MMPAHGMKWTSNINAHGFFLHTANLIGCKLLNVFSNNAVRATERDPVYGDGDELRTDCDWLWAGCVPSSTIHECVTISAGTVRTIDNNVTVQSTLCKGTV